MIKLDLLKKNDIMTLLEGFDTPFFQGPVRQSPKSFTKFIPNGFRPEKLSRSQLINMFADVLNVRLPGITDYVLDTVQTNFENAGIEAYMNEKIKEGTLAAVHIVALTTIVFDKHMSVPASLILMLYGIDCPAEEKQLAEQLYNVLRERITEAEKMGYEEGFEKGGASYSSDLEAEKRKVQKLQKTVDNAAVRAKNDEQVAKQQQMEYQKLLTASEKTQKQLAERESSLQQTQDALASSRALADQQTLTIADLKQKLNQTAMALDESQAQVHRLTAELEGKIAITAEEMKNICMEAINQFHVQGQRKEDVLALAKQKFAESDDVKTAWKKLCDDSAAIIDELFDLLANNTFTFSLFDKFIELEQLLLIENAIKHSLCLVAHKIMASDTEKDTLYGNFTVQE